MKTFVRRRCILALRRLIEFIWRRDIINIKKLFEERGEKAFYLTAETAFIHDGDLGYLTKLVNAAAQSTCDGVKFQILLDNDNANNTNLTNFKDIEKWIFPKDEWLKLIAHARQAGMEVIILPVDLYAVQFCKEHQEHIDAIELHSACFNDYFMLKMLASMPDMPIILGIGGRSLEDIDYALELLCDNKHVMLMFGFQSFPTNIQDLNLAKIRTYRERYDFPVGYADHTQYDDPFGDALVEYAYLLGARLFEKHLTLEKGKERIDYHSAVEYQDIAQLRKKIERLITALGDDDYSHLNAAELKYRDREKQLVFTKNMKAGEMVTEECLGYKVSASPSDFEQRDVHKVLGKKLKRKVEYNKVVCADDLE